MNATRAPGKTARRPRAVSPHGVIERTQENEKAIQASMKRWRHHNEHGRSIGRGLSDAELIANVAGEIGASKAYVRYALRQED